MADLTANPVLSAIATSNSRLSELPVKDGQLIFVQDKSTIAFDYGGKRVLYRQIEEISTESARTSMLAPVNGHYYFVVDTGVMWTYRNGWVQITSAPNEIKDYADSIADSASADATSKANAALDEAKVYADEIGKRVTCRVDDDGKFIITFNNQWWTAE